MAEISDASPMPPQGKRPIAGGRLGPRPPPSVHARMGRRSMSVAGDAIMMAAAAAAAAGNHSILSSSVVGRKLQKQDGTTTGGKPASREASRERSRESVAGSASVQLPGTPVDVSEITGATSDNPEPIVAAGALVRKGDARGLSAEKHGGTTTDQLMECRPLFEPMKSNAQGMDDTLDMEPTIIIKTSFISQLEGQEGNMEALQGASSGVNLPKFLADHRALMLDFFRYEFRRSDDLHAFRKAIGLPWYTVLPLVLLLLLVLSGTGLLLWVRYQVSLAEGTIQALKVPPPIDPDFSDQVLFAKLNRHYLTPGQESRKCRCVDWTYDPRVRYHVTEVRPVEQNAFARFYSTVNRTMIRSMELYMEPYSAAKSGISYCAQPGMHENHECDYLPDVGTTLQLLWQWSP